MSGPAILLSLLFGTAVVMTIALAIAFAHFGRQRHVLTWTASYAVGVLQWLANAAGFFLQSAAMFIVTGTALVVSASLLAIGIRQRSSRRVNIMAFAAPAAIVCIMIAVAIGFFGNQILQGMIIPTYVGLLLLVSAASLWPIDRAMTPPEKAFFAFLILFALCQLALAVSATFIRSASEGKDLYRNILSLGMPTIYVGPAVYAVLVVAGDLAQQLRSQMRHDPLTEVLNRRGLEEAASQAIAQARRHGRPLSLVICDLDGFKALNDNHGHIAGDHALKGFAQLLILAVRRGDIVGRMGGDEFGLLLQDSDAQAAADVMERVRLEVAHLSLPKVPESTLRASFGVAALLPEDLTLEDMVHRADEALYSAKKLGKNRVSIAGAA
jgi:diguanylate cyclase (GGDEF)-like protein